MLRKYANMQTIAAREKRPRNHCDVYGEEPAEACCLLRIHVWFCFSSDGVLEPPIVVVDLER